MIPAGYKKVLLRLFEDVRTLSKDSKDVELCFEIQKKILKYIKKIERIVRKKKDEIKALAKLKSTGRLPKDQVRALNLQIEKKQQILDNYIYLISIFRDIGDSLAFIYIDKSDLKPLCLDKETSGFISGKKGHRLEWSIVKAIMKEKKAVCILNDLTHSIRYGDITVPMGGKPFLIECKSGKKKKFDPRLDRQVKNIERLHKYLAEDVTENLFKATPGKSIRVSPHKKEKSNNKQLNQLLEVGSQTKQDTKLKVENGLYYFALPNGMDQNIFDGIPKGKWVATIINGMKYTKQAYLPFPLVIDSPEILYSFYAGEITIMVMADMDLLTKQLLKRGIEIEFDEKDEMYPVTLKRLQEEGEVGMKVSSYLFGRFAAEFISFKWFRDEIVYGFEEFQKMKNIFIDPNAEPNSDPSKKLIKLSEEVITEDMVGKTLNIKINFEKR